jgi:hypothetical protein
MTCKHCREEIGFVGDRWLHRAEDGPDAKLYCECHCFDCDPREGYPDEHECCDGEVAEPDCGHGMSALDDESECVICRAERDEARAERDR